MYILEYSSRGHAGDTRRWLWRDIFLSVAGQDLEQKQHTSNILEVLPGGTANHEPGDLAIGSSEPRLGNTTTRLGWELDS